MKNNIYKFISFILIVLLIAFMYRAVDKAQVKRDDEGLEVLSQAIMKSAVQCYALEGFYPPNIQYLEDNYGLLVNHDKYFISYRVFASNIMPEVDVFPKYTD